MADEPLIDRGHLDTQTFGDEDLARELLDLFAEQCRRHMPGIADPSQSTVHRADLAHTLKGSALGVGTMRVATLASEAEEALRAGSSAATDRIRALAGAVEETLSVLAAGG